MKKFLGLAIATLVFCGLMATGATSAKNDAYDDSAELREAVDSKGVIKHLRKLDKIADENGGTRVSGTPGYDASADYVAKKMEKAGYEVTRQPFEFDLFTEESPSEFSQVTPEATDYVDGTDFDTMEYSGSGDVTAELVAIDLVIPPGAEASTSNSGCEAGDFTDTGVSGKIALMQRGTCDFAVKVDNAIAAGAVGAIVFNEGQDGRQDLLFGTLAPPLRSVPAFGLPFALGEELANGETSGATGVTVRMFADTSSEVVETENVIADSTTGDEGNVVMAGAHLDSVAEGPGINDNGSGSAGILETARKISKLGIEPENHLRFAWWGAEEANLIGSTEYVAQLDEYQAADIALYLNFDMIGSPNFGRFIYDGNGSAFDLEGPEGSDTIERVFQRFFSAEDLASGQTAFDGRSDYLPFIDVGIPSGGLFTGAEDEKTEAEAALYGGTPGEAFDPCYHADCDDISNVSKRALDQMTDAVAHAVNTFAFDLEFVRETEAERRARATTQSSPRDRAGDAYVR